jgi:hypothetical protein
VSTYTFMITSSIKNNFDMQERGVHLHIHDHISHTAWPIWIKHGGGKRIQETVELSNRVKALSPENLSEITLYIINLKQANVSYSTFKNWFHV